MTSVAFRIVGVAARANGIREKIAFSTIDKGNVVLRSQLERDTPLNDHLVWLWGLLKHHRRFLKAIQAEGGRLECICEVPKGEVRIMPNGAEMLHLLGAELIVNAK